MNALKEFLGIRRTVALWETRADAELGAVHGLGLSDFAALHHLAEAPGGKLRRVDPRGDSRSRRRASPGCSGRSSVAGS